MCEHHTCPHFHPRARYFVCLLERSSPAQEIRTGSVFCSVGFVGKGTFFTLQRRAAQTPIRNVSTHVQDRRGAASFHYRNRSGKTVNICLKAFEQKPCPIKFSCRCKSNPVKRKQSLNVIVLQTTPRKCTKKR